MTFPPVSFGSHPAPPPQVFTELMSFLKGSAEAVRDTATGQLSREQYLSIGAKKAPNFSRERREQASNQLECIVGSRPADDLSKLAIVASSSGV